MAVSALQAPNLWANEQFYQTCVRFWAKIFEFFARVPVSARRGWQQNSGGALQILAFDTAARACSAALLDGDRVLAERLCEMERGQAEVLIGLVQDVLATAGTCFAKIDRLATTLGPGSFTGLRVGLATARGIALAARLPVVGVTSFEAVANGVASSERKGRRVLVALDTKRRDFYAQLFDEALHPLDPGGVLSLEACAGMARSGPLLVVGDGAPLLRDAFTHNAEMCDADACDIRWSKAPGHPQAVVIARLAATRAPTADLRPIYLRPPEAKRPKA